MNLISLSGGKDSTAMLLLAIERQTEEMRVIFCDTGNEHPLTYQYIDYLKDKLGICIETLKADFSDRIAKRKENLAEVWGEDGISSERIQFVQKRLNPTGNPFLDLAMLKGRFPSTRMRFCTQELKINLIRKEVYNPVLANGIDINAWQGIRRDESVTRSCAKERDLAMRNDETGAEVWNYRPILDWKAEDCFFMLEKHGIEPNPLYRLGMTRVGCMPCINLRKSELKEISNRFPDQIERVADWEKKVSDCSKHGLASYFPWVNGAHNISEMVIWAKTEKGGKQFSLLDGLDLPTCASQYGLCE